jgi:hypothetical protein
MTRISLPLGWWAQMSARKATNSALVARSGFAENLARLGVERGVERQGAVPIILEAMAFEPPGRERQHRIEPIKRLDRGLFRRRRTPPRAPVG